MKAVIGIIKHKSTVQLMGVAALCALIWYAGPWVAFAGRTPLLPEFNRLLAILGVVSIWAGHMLFSQALAKKTDQQLIAELSTPKEDPAQAAVAQAQDQQVADLRRKFEEALHKLKQATTKSRRDKQYLYQLPWYIIIGAPGSGKTTALVNSGLKFPLSDRPGSNAVQGVGGTRNCDWFFAEEAVFLDTAGRYTTQDSHQPVDAAAWSGFLDLIKKHRPRRPINGVLVTMSASDLLQGSEEERSRHAGELRKRIQELYEVLGMRFPIYMLFTKCDLVAGFTDFFADLGHDERAQVWGETFSGIDSRPAQDLIAEFGTGYEELLQRLTHRSYKRIEEERDIQRRGLILDFPQQMALLKPAMMSLLYETFSASRYETEPLLRGVYFTSGTQEGTPIDRVLGRLAKAYGLDRQNQPIFSGRAKAYFINRLLNEVVIQEAELAGVDLGVERRRTRLRWAAYGCLSLLSAGLVGMWSLSYARNRSAVDEVKEQIAFYQIAHKERGAIDSGVKPLLERLNVLQTAHDVYADRTWGMRYGLYQGEKLQSEINRVYAWLLKSEFLPYIKALTEQRMSEQLRVSKAYDSEIIYELLKVYLMLGDPSRMEPKLAGACIQKDFERTFFREPRVRDELVLHASRLLNDHFEPIDLNQALIVAARKKLNAIPLPMQIYAHLKTEGLSDRSHDFILMDALGRYADQVFTTADAQGLQKLSIPGLYTRHGYRALFERQGLGFVEKALEQNWVLENPAAEHPGDLDRLHDDLQKLYFADYERMWRDLLGNLRIRRTQGIHETILLLDMLSGPDTPLRFLLEAVMENTSLAREAATDGSAEHERQSAETEKAALQWSQKHLSDVTPPPLREMERRFEDLNALVRGTEKSPPPLNNILLSLRELRDVMMQIGSAAKSEEQALKMARERMGGAGASDAMKRARLEFARLPEPLASWFQSLTSFGWQITLASAKSELDSIWKTDVLTPYRAGLDQRYPLFVASRHDATMADFCRFFAPNGIIDQFFQNHLKPFVDTTRAQWRPLSMDDHGIGVSPEALKQFQYAAKIRDTFFAGGGRTPSIRFELKPVFLDENIGAFRLDIEGQTIVYRHGPVRSTEFTWPGPRTDIGVRFNFQTLDGRELHQSEEGPWAWLRVLDKARVERTGLPDRFLVTFEQDGFKARFELRAESVENPFHLTELRNFRCPRSL